MAKTGKVNKDITQDITTRNPNNQTNRFLFPEEAKVLLSACERVRGAPHLKAIVTIALHTGMRQKEIFNLRWEDINFRTRLITVGKSKNNEGRHIPINNLLYDCLKGLIRRVDTNLLFPSVDKKGNIAPLTTLKKSFKTALKIAGISDFHFHDLRHTFASWAVMSGMSLYKLSKILGHKDIKMTQRYAHLAPNNLYDVTLSVDRFFTSGIDNPDTYRTPEGLVKSSVTVSD